MLALVDTSAPCVANGVSNVGFCAAALLYAVASNPSEYAASFNNVTVGNNDIYGLDAGLVFPGADRVSTSPPGSDRRR